MISILKRRKTYTVIKDLFKHIIFFAALIIIIGVILIIKVCKFILGILFTPVLKNSMDDCPLHILFIKQLGVFLLYTASGIAYYYIHLLFNSDINLMDNLITMWSFMIVIECIIPMIKQYATKK